jgi:alkanesulfonate monooxygenase SsuD/methylene tetrahydromethanopterin reductase-like flavin-dependent oxidoreductase (luciferase family)
MLLSWFTEQPMLSYPEQRALERYPDDHPARRLGDTVLLFSNRFFDPIEGSRLYRLRLREAQIAEEAGFDAVMTNEHHNAPFCMSARCNIISAAVLTATDRIRVLQAGNPLPLWDNPVQLAEEIALLDMLSGGRVIAGIVRGGGQEQLANNVNPAFNRELFDEAHDLMVSAWTEPGPFSWEGEHFQMRVVNPWALPLQQPHPRIVVPGVASTETLAWAAHHGYPYLALNTPLEQTKRMWRTYAEEAATVGVAAGPEHRGYLLKCHILRDSARARRNAEQFNWMRGEFAGVGNFVWNSPAGFASLEARKARRRHVAAMAQPVAEAIDAGLIFAGTPEEVMPQLRMLLEETRPSILVFWGADGKVSHEDTVECIRIIGEEVLPEVRVIGRELGLLDPFEADAPVGVGRGPVRIAGERADAAETADRV